MRGVVRLLPVAGLLLHAGASLAADPTVFIGSAGPHYAALADPANVRALIAAGNVGLYQHANGNAALPPPVRARLWATWGLDGAGKGATVGEVGEFPAVDAGYRSYFGGAYPATINMNVEFHGVYEGGARDVHPGHRYTGQASGADLQAMRAAIGVARAAGARAVAIVATPNSGGEDLDDPFATSAFWANVRTIATEGGGIALDPPPSYWKARGPAYQGIVRQMLAWANAQGLRSSLIVSPFAVSPDGAGHGGGCGHDDAFLANTRAMVADLTAAGTLPSEWVVEAYGAPGDACGTENDAAADGTPGSLNEVALFLSRSGGVSARGR